MGYPVKVAFRYLRAKKAAFVSVGTLFAILGVALGVAALATVMSVTGGFQAQFRDKVLGVNAHVLVLKYSSDFREYRDVMKVVEKQPGVIGVGPFTINPMMVTHGTKTATGVLLKGVDPELMPKVLDVPNHVVEPADHQIVGLRRPGAAPPKPLNGTFGSSLPALPPLPTASGSAAPAPSFEKDEQGRPLSVIRAIKKDIEAADARKNGQPVEAKPAKKDVDEDDDVTTLPKTAPHGATTPEGGFKSELPDADDDLPDDIVPDPCGKGSDVAKLPGAIIGRSLAKNLELKLGDCLQVTSPTIGYSYSGGMMRPPVAKQFRVIAIFEAGFDQYDSKLVYVDLYEAQAFYDMGDSVTGVEMKVSDIDEAKRIAHEIDVRLDNGMYHTMDWEELNHGLFTALKIQQIGMSAVLALIIVVAAFTVIATLIMVVLDKKKEIAVLKAMGATDEAILRIFLYQGGVIGLVGTGLGLAIGVVFCLTLRDRFPLDPKVYFISKLPVEVRPAEFLLTGAIAIAICLLATVAPALYAAWLRPTDGFRDVD